MLPSHGRSHWFKSSTAYQWNQGITVHVVPLFVFLWKRPLKNAQFCSSSRKAKILTTPYDLPDLRGRHEYMEYFEDKANASLRAKCWAWHRNWAKGGVLQRSLDIVTWSLKVVVSICNDPFTQNILWMKWVIKSRCFADIRCIKPSWKTLARKYKCDPHCLQPPPWSSFPRYWILV